ncbi:4Fe-4S dicluster domain-containing protein [Desulfofalx alkaliphila]|uniref:4Fe-4S dicluster domain-containing protein n=1 Tax=Desulfofalx alkaliphila TaxID=105483 RepID=UPI00068B959D|nr:4Fe-4S dicluster domain-containing protein [Desulfofalx alkaliphila]
MNIVTNQGSKELNFTNFVLEVKERSCQPLELCYQCQKCSAGCQVGDYTDFHPSQIIRMIQFGLKEEVLKSKFIWLCANCETCGARCPNGISTSAISDALREIALEEKVPASEKNIPIFHENFLNAVKSNGRIHEATMLAMYKLKSGDLFSDIKMGLDLFTRGKLPLLPARVKTKGKIRQIFNDVDKTKMSNCSNNDNSISM